MCDVEKEEVSNASAVLTFSGLLCCLVAIQRKNKSVISSVILLLQVG